MIDGNAWLNEFIGKNWLVLLLAYHVLDAAFPSWRFLDRLGEAMTQIFPVFKKRA